MLTYELMVNEGILILTPDGPLEHEDFTRVSAAIDEYIVKHGTLCGIMIYAESFPGWDDFDALMSHVKFIKENSADFDRVAAVTDSKLLTFMPKIVDHFVSAEVRHFEYGAREDAKTWLSCNK
jgi:hypothetical protein